MSSFVGHGDHPLSLIERFWSKVDKTGECWLWRGSVNGSGYGRFWLSANTYVMAHRFAYELEVGPISEGLHIDHVRSRGCRSRRCVNPAHLEPVTQLENTRRGGNSAKTHCKNNHPLFGDNLRIVAGRRVCVTCSRERVRASRNVRRKEFV
jgi:hypothetical protein